MIDDAFDQTEPAPAERPAYEPPQLREYGSLRVDTAGAFTGTHLDFNLNIS